MSGKKKVTKKKAKAKNKEKQEDAQSVASELSISSSKTSKTSKSTKVKKSAKKKVAKSVLSDQNIGITLKEMKKGVKGKKPSKISKITLSSLKITDKGLPPAEVPKPIKIPAFPEIDYNTQPPLQSSAKIKEAIEGADANSQILIPEGLYNVQLNITKPLSIIGQGGVVFLSQGKNHTINVDSNGVSLKGIAVIQKYSPAHSAINCKSGSLRIEDCVVMSELTPALIVAGESTATVCSSSITATAAPSVITTESSKCLFDSCDISQSKSTGMIVAGSSSVKITRCSITNNKKCGIICRDAAKMYIEKSAFSSCGVTGIEIGSSSNLTAVVSSSVVNCGFSGISVYGLATTAISDTLVTGCTGPAIYCRGGCGVLLNGNVLSKCGSPALLYLHEGATMDSTNDTFSDATVAGICIFNNSELSITNPTFKSLGRGIVVNDNGILTLNNGKMNDITKTGVSSLGTATILINGLTINKAGETGVSINGTKTFEIHDSTIKNCAQYGIDIASCSDIVVTNCTLSNNKKHGLISTDTSVTVTGGEAKGNEFAAYEFVGCKGTLKETTIAENSIGIICSGKGSASIEKSNITNNKKHGIVAIAKSAITLRGSSLTGNGIFISGKSVAKIRSSQFSKCGTGMSIFGHSSSGDIEGTKFESCKAGIILRDESKATTKETDFTDDKLGIEVGKGCTLTSEKDNFNENNGKASIAVIAEGTATVNKSSFTNPGYCGLFAQGATSVTFGDNVVKHCNVSGIIIKDCSTVEITEAKLEKNTRSGAIVSGSGTISITKTKFKKNGEASILLGNGADPKLEENETEEKATAAL